MKFYTEVLEESDLFIYVLGVNILGKLTMKKIMKKVFGKDIRHYYENNPDVDISVTLRSEIFKEVVKLPFDNVGRTLTITTIEECGLWSIEEDVDDTSNVASHISEELVAEPKPPMLIPTKDVEEAKLITTPKVALFNIMDNILSVYRNGSIDEFGVFVNNNLNVNNDMIVHSRASVTPYNMLVMLSSDLVGNTKTNQFEDEAKQNIDIELSFVTLLTEELERRLSPEQYILEVGKLNLLLSRYNIT